MIVLRIKRKIVLSVFGCLLLSVFVTTPGHSDGLAIRRDPVTLLWDLLAMNDQVAAIRYDGGVERMLLSINLTDLKTDSALWIFPIPALPDQVAIKLINGFPLFKGQDFFEAFKERYNHSFLAMRMLACPPLALGTMLFDPAVMRIRLQGSVRSVSDGVTVHKSIERSGVTAELVTARDGKAFYDYVKTFTGQLPVSITSIIDGYVGRDFSFIVSRISDIERFKREASRVQDNDVLPEYQKPVFQLSLSAVFPTSKIFFPMRLTGIYGEAKIPMTVYVLGHVTPELSRPLQRLTDVDYLTSGRQEGDFPELKDFVNGVGGSFNFTKIVIQAPSRLLTDDLWMDAKAPPKVARVQRIYDHQIALWVILFAILSGISSVCAAVMAYGLRSVRSGRFFFFGLLNFFSIACMACVAKWARISQTLVKDERESLQSMSWNRAITICLSIGAVLWVGFLVLSGTAFLLLMSLAYLPYALTSLTICLLFPSCVVMVLANDRPTRFYLCSFMVIFYAMSYGVQWFALQLLHV